MDDLLKFITCGSVDDGKSTLIGDVLAPVPPTEVMPLMPELDIGDVRVSAAA